jgi:hypothetical protein
MVEDHYAYWQEKAEEYLRLAQKTTNPILAEQSAKLAAAYSAAAEEMGMGMSSETSP